MAAAAEDAYLRAIELAPGDLEIRVEYLHWLRDTHMPGQPLSEHLAPVLERGLEIAPNDPRLLEIQAWAEIEEEYAASLTVTPSPTPTSRATATPGPVPTQMPEATPIPAATPTDEPQPTSAPTVEVTTPPVPSPTPAGSSQDGACALAMGALLILPVALILTRQAGRT